MSLPRLGWFRIGIAIGGLVGVVVLVFGGFFVADRFGVSTPLSSNARSLTLTTGSLAGRRNEIAESYLAPAAKRYGLTINIVPSIGSEDALNQVHSGKIDLALVGGGLSTEGRDNVREVIPLYVEPLHLLISPALAAALPTADLATQLRGRSVSLDLVGTGTHTLVQTPDGLLGMLGLTAGDFTESPRSLDQVADPNVDCDSLPDALFVLGPLPHPGAANLITRCDYHLRPMPFAEALHLKRNQIYGATIPDGAYRLDPAEPRGALPTIGTQLLLVANKDIPDSVVQKLLAAILETSFSHLYEPPLDINQLSVVPEFPQHPGVIAYISSKQPVTLEGVSTATKLIALVTSAIPITLIIMRTFTQWRIRDRVFNVNAYIGDLTRIEREARELEPGSVDRARGLLSRVVGLRASAMEKSSKGELKGSELLPAFLAYATDVTRYLDRLSTSRRSSNGGSNAESGEATLVRARSDDVSA